MSPYYPVLLNLSGQRCLVIGDAHGKDHGLEQVGAQVVRKDEYQPGDLEGFFLVIAGGGDHALNARIWQEARQRGTLFNAVDDAGHSNFILPAIHREGDLILAVSSSGKSPALASRLRDRFAAQLGRAYAEFLDLLGEMRPAVQARYERFEERKQAYLRMLDSEAFGLLEKGERKEAQEALEEAML